MKKTLLMLCLFLLLGEWTMAQTNWLNAQLIVEESAQDFDLLPADIVDLQLSSSHQSSLSGITHYYIQQRFQGIDIAEAILDVHILEDDSALKINSRAVNNLAEKINTTIPVLTPSEAIQAAIAAMEYPAVSELEILEPSVGMEQLTVFAGGLLSKQDIPVQLIYERVDEETLRLAWQIRVFEPTGEHWWTLRIDAENGTLLSQQDHILRCQWDKAGFTNHEHHKGEEHYISIPEAVFQPFMAGSYRVFPLGVESPSHGQMSVVNNPDDALASPRGWHDTNNANGAEYTITRGNNVYAQQDLNGDNNTNSPGYAPNGGSALNFNYTYDLTKDPINDNTNLNASLTNLFYWNNIMHDVFYHYGFTEAAGNFQENNYGRGGTANDAISADGQDGSGTNNANFGTAGDGSTARMQMFLFSASHQVIANSPSSVQGNYSHSVANWANVPTGSYDITEELVIGTYGGGNTDACSPITNAVSGKIVLVDRGTCEFGFKAKNAEDRGAVAVVICNNEQGTIDMGSGADGDDVTIPVVMLSQGDCATLRSELPGVNLTIANGGFARDGSLDNGIIAHEYGHGISIRLTGGKENAACLTNAEQMGEGWSDLFGLILTMKAGDTRELDRGVGTFALSEPNSGGGIRTHRYSTNEAVNPHTYADVSDFDGFFGVSPHGVGSIWCEMLWEMTWNLVDKHGFDNDFYTGTGGNNIALGIVTEGLKLQPCNPGFVDGRDAILAADKIMNNGDNECEIWCAFAKRGLGVNADQGDANDLNDSVESYDIPASLTSCDCNDLPRIALPLELSHFTGSTLATSNLLEWETATETNIAHHIVERSEDGKTNWERMGTQKSVGNTTSPSTYQLLDEKPLTKAYYRLLSLDLSGRENYSNTILLERKVAQFADFHAYPNPTSSMISVGIQLAQEQVLEVQIQNVLGQTLSTQTQVGKIGLNTFSVDMSDLSAGVYWLVIHDGERTVSKRILKN